MPNGITSDLYNGKDVTLKDFAIRAARSLDYYMHVESLNAPLTRYTANTVHDRACLDKYQTEYDEFTAKSDKEQLQVYREEMAAAQEARQKYEEDRLALRKRYADMLMQIIMWEPPQELTGLKKHMEDACRNGMEFDTAPPVPLPSWSFVKWRDMKIASLERRIRMYSDDIQRELERQKVQNAFHEAFLDAFPEV